MSPTDKSNGQSLDVVGIGSMVADLLYRAPRIIGADEKIILTRHESNGNNGAIDDRPIVKRIVGGVTLNHLSWARILGLKVGIVGKQADDEVGRFLRGGIEALGIESHIRLSGTASSFAHIFVGPAGERAIYMAPGDTAETTPLDVSAHFADTLTRASIISTEISQLPLPAVLAVLTIAKDAGIPTVLDVDVPMSDALQTLGTEEEFHEALQLATYIKPAAAACAELVPGEVMDQGFLAASEFIRGRYDCDAVVITDGENGCMVDTESFQGRVTPPKISPVDTTGAGDAFLGGMIAGLTWKLDWTDIAALANACGAACCELVGAAPDLGSSMARVLELYKGPELPIEVTSKSSTAGTSPASGADLSEPVYADALNKFLDTVPFEIKSLRDRIKIDQISEVAELILERESKGARVHITGTGKCEHVAKYVASLFSSTGTPAYFLHATETTHGSAGQVRPGDVVIAISNSGSTLETNNAVIALVKIGAHIVAVTKSKDTNLGRVAESTIELGTIIEGGPLGLAPRGSILAQCYALAAVSVALQAQKGISEPLYNSWHPAGELGKKSGGRN